MKTQTHQIELRALQGNALVWLLTQAERGIKPSEAIATAVNREARRTLMQTQTPPPNHGTQPPGTK